MIRRFSHDGVLEAVTRRRVNAGNVKQDSLIEAPSLADAADAADAQAYRKGYAEGFEAGESDGLRDATQRMQELEDAAQHRLHELTDERDRVAALLQGMNDELAQHGERMQTLAFEVALLSLSRAFGQMHEDRQLIQRLCSEVAREFRAKAVRVAVSPYDRSAMPDDIEGLTVIAEPGLAPGHCRIVTERGYGESSIGMRLAGIYAAMRQALGIDSP